MAPESPSAGEFRPILEEVEKESSSNDTFSEADVAVIIVNRFVIKPVLAPPTKRYQLVEDLFHRLRKYPTINTSGTKIEVEVE